MDEMQEELRLNKEQQAELGDIFLSARAVSRQMVTQARAQSDEILKTARDRAEQIVQDAEEKAARILREAEEQAAATRENAVPPVVQNLTPEMQEYIVRCVGDCFSQLHQQQLDAAEFINRQWQSFLSGLPLTDTAPPALPPAKRPDDDGGEISRQEIESRVSAIARELMEIIGQ